MHPPSSPNNKSNGLKTKTAMSQIMEFAFEMIANNMK